MYIASLRSELRRLPKLGFVTEVKLRENSLLYFRNLLHRLVWALGYISSARPDLHRHGLRAREILTDADTYLEGYSQSAVSFERRNRGNLSRLEELDVSFLVGSLEHSVLFDRPLWQVAELEKFAQDGLNAWNKFWDTSHGSWAFWQEWYQGFLNGKPLDWELQRRVSLIDDAIWDAGPEAVAKEIEKIRTTFDLEKRIEELEADLRRATIDRHGIGGNLPPEMLDDVPIAPELVTVWQPLEDLRYEIAKEHPDPTCLQKIIEALVTATKIGIAWCLKKGDLIVDTAIKWAIPAVGTGYLALNPEKLEAVIEAVKKLLSVL